MTTLAPSDADRLLKKARQFRREGKLLHAAEVYTELLRNDFQPASVLAERAAALEYAGNLYRAARDYEQAIALRPPWEAAIPKHIFDSEPIEWQWLWHLGQVHRRNLELASSARRVTDYLNLKFISEDRRRAAEDTLASIIRKRRSLDVSINAASELIGSNPLEPSHVFHRAFLLECSGRFAEALRDVQRAEELLVAADEPTRRARRRRVRLLFRLGRWSETVAAANTLEARSSVDAESMRLRALSNFELGNLEAAKEEWMEWRRRYVGFPPVSK